MFEVAQHRYAFRTPMPLSSLAGTGLAPASLTGVERRALEGAASPTRAVKAKVDLIREGEFTDRVYILVEGWACRYKTTRDGSRQIIALLVPGDVANTDTLMFRRANFGVRVLSSARVASISRERLAALACEHDGINSAVIRLVAVENAILGQWAVCLGRCTAHTRIAHLLCELAVRARGLDANNFDLPLTQKHLADALGLTSVHVNRTMQQLRSEGLIATVGCSISFPDVAKIWKRAGFDPAYLHLEDDEVDELRRRPDGDGR